MQNMQKYPIYTSLRQRILQKMLQKFWLLKNAKASFIFNTLNY